MKVKYLKDLDTIESQKFMDSELYVIMIQEWKYIKSYILYSQEYFGEEYVDYSVVIFDENDFYIGFYAYTKDKILSFFNQPINVYNILSSSKNLYIAYNSLFKTFEDLKIENKILSIHFYDNAFLLSEFIEKIEISAIEMDSYIDLTQSEELIKMNVRKSYKSLINWGHRNLKIELINYLNPNKILFDEFRNFHILVSGRQTRSNLSWDLQYESILKNEAFLVLSFLNDDIVSGSYVIHNTEISYYGVAVNNRDLMAQNIPIGHYTLFNSILQAKSLGIKKFILGNINLSDDEKINAIIRYKKGFSNTVKTNIKFVVNI
jgi:hypothetical protein